MAPLHANMDNEASKRQYRMIDAAHRRDTKRLWGLIVACTEAAFISTLELKDAAAKRMKGRNMVTCQDGSAEIKEDDERNEADAERQARLNAGTHSGQANKLANVARRMQMASSAATNAEKKQIHFA